jgi:Uma2 family endonuclease
MEVALDNRGTIPGWVKDHASFRRWTRSPNYPPFGQFAWLGKRLWMDLNMERDSHNQIKSEFCAILRAWAKKHRLGKYWGDRMLLSHVESGLSSEPDGMFATWNQLRRGRIRLIGGQAHDGVELIGTPDMVLEVVSPSSVQKDMKDLPELYWAAGIPEYWLIDPRGPELRFNILRHTTAGYRSVPKKDGWRKSAVFGAAFRLTQTADPLGEPAFTLEMR